MTEPVESLPDGLPAALARPGAHPHDDTATAGVEHRQTHISHLFLTRDRVYKLRKAVVHDFVSFATRRARNEDCLREVALNRRLAPDVYLGLAPVLGDAAGGFRLGPPGEALVTPPGAEAPAEHCVVMRRLPGGRDAESLLEAGRLRRDQVTRLAARLVDFHAAVGLGRPAPFPPEDWLARVAAPVGASFALAREAGAGLLDEAVLDRLERAMSERRAADREAILARRAEGRLVDGHGDLHLDAVWFETDDAEPVVIDCLEFDRDLRTVDAAAELAFFAMDAAYRGRPDLGEHLLATYAARADDFGLYDVVDDHMLHRALVRAGVAALAARDEGVGAGQRAAAADSARRHLEWMARWADRPRRPLVLITTGLPGTGKSTVARAAAEAVGAVVIASDRVRAHEDPAAGANPPHPPHPPEPPADDAPGAARYARARTDAVYAGLLDRAAHVLGSGRAVVLDATHARREHRDAALALARRHDAQAWLIDVRCETATTLERLRVRLQDPDRLSDAGPRVYRVMEARYEPPDEWDASRRLVVHTDDADWRHALAERLDAQGLVHPFPASPRSPRSLRSPRPAEPRPSEPEESTP